MNKYLFLVPFSLLLLTGCAVPGGEVVGSSSSPGTAIPSNSDSGPSSSSVTLLGSYVLNRQGTMGPQFSRFVMYFNEGFQCLAEWSLEEGDGVAHLRYSIETGVAPKSAKPSSSTSESRSSSSPTSSSEWNVLHLAPMGEAGDSKFPLTYDYQYFTEDYSELKFGCYSAVWHSEDENGSIHEGILDIHYVFVRQ